MTTCDIYYSLVQSLLMTLTHLDFDRPDFDMSAWASSSQPTVPPAQVISYSIAECSEHSGNYIPENILVDVPHDQSSRWSGAQQSPAAKQWILLRLETLSVIS
jgi:hypothetical protein